MSILPFLMVMHAAEADRRRREDQQRRERERVRELEEKKEAKPQVKVADNGTIAF